MCRHLKLGLLVLASGLCAFGIPEAQDARALLQAHKCYSCHADGESLTGPAYADVAATYRGNENAVSILAGVIRKGSHPGGPWHMPPHPEISNAEAEKIAHYILSSDRSR